MPETITLPIPDVVTPTTIKPRALSLNVHYDLSQNHLIQPGDHPKILADDPPFVAAVVLYSIGIHSDGRLTMDATLHSEMNRDVRGCLPYTWPNLPAWLPKPAEGWETFAADMWAYLTGTEVQA